jgi:predicted TIM-barrel fold metal-dependent hydrolase
MIIDGHTHIFPREVRQDRQKYCRTDPAFRAIYDSGKARMIGAESLIGEMDKSEVDMAVVCAFPWQNHDLCARGNDAILEAVHRFPSRLIGFGCVFPGEPDQAVMEIDRCVGGGIRGIGELGFYHRGMNHQDCVEMEPICRAISAQKIPLLLHVSETVGHSYPGKGNTDLREIFRFISSFPEIIIILAHWGGGLIFYEMMPSVSQVTRQVYYDTAASPLLYRKSIYRVACEIVGPDRILFGSDYPLISPRRHMEEIKEAGLGQRTMSKILGDNMGSLLAL